MEDSKRVYKFLGKPGEDFFLWAARTEAALAAKDVLDLVEWDVFERSPDLSEEVSKRVCTARAVIIQGLGDRPLRLCLPVKDNPYRMWSRLRDRYAVSNTATKVQLQTRLSRMTYKGQCMQDYVDCYEEIFNRLASMESAIAEDLQIAMLLASFGDKNSSPFGHALASLQTTQGSLSWESATALLIQEYDEQLLRETLPRKTANAPGNAKALSAGAQRAHIARGSGKRRFGADTRWCYSCGKMGHIARNCQTQRRNGVTDAIPDPHNGGAQNAMLLYARLNSQLRKSNTTGGEEKSLCIYDLPTPASATATAGLDHGCSSGPDESLLLDSGASHHMAWDRKRLSQIRNVRPVRIVLGNGEVVCAKQAGNLTIRGRSGTLNKTCDGTVVLREVLPVPELLSNLVSCTKLCSEGFDISMKRNSCRITLDGVLQMEAEKYKGVYRIIETPSSNGTTSALAGVSRITPQHGERQRSTPKSMAALWHLRLGHAYNDSIKKLDRSGAVLGLNLEGSVRNLSPCNDCQKGKQTRKSLRKNNHRSTERGAVIHTDVCGPMTVPSFSGCRYFVSFIDEYSGYTTIVPIRHKSDVTHEFQRYMRWIERKFDCSVKRVHSDLGGEYLAMRSFLTEKGIEHSTSPPYSPNLNGISERTNRTIIECARSMLQHASLPRKFWAEAVVHAASIRNVFFSPREQTKTSSELMSGQVPRVGHMRVFGCKGWHHIPTQLRGKLDPKAEPGIIIGCAENYQYKLWIPMRNVAVLSRDVTVAENEFPGSQLRESVEEVRLAPAVRTDASSGYTDEEDLATSIPTASERVGAPSPANLNASPHKQQTLTQGAAPFSEEQLKVVTYTPPDEVNTVQSSDNGIEEHSERIEASANRYPRRERRPPQLFDPSDGASAQAHIGLTASDSVPNTVEEALASCEGEEWKSAIDCELESLRAHGTWKIVRSVPYMKPLSTKLIFSRKVDGGGNIVRHKARMVVRGFLQGDVEQTFAPVVDFTTVRVCLMVAVQRGYDIQQLDIKTAFLHGDIDAEVVVKPPPGINICRSNEVLSLQRGLYGLKQAPRLWHDKWKAVMSTMGFVALVSDECVYRRNLVWMLLYVDDIIVMGPSRKGVARAKSELSNHLDVKDMGGLQTFLGVRFIRGERGASLSQQSYIEQVLQRFGMDSCKAVDTPMSSGTRKELMDPKGESADRTTYQELLGCLLFLSTRTRPDISAAVAILSRFTANPLQLHWIALKRVLRYLKGTTGFGLRMPLSKECILMAFCDADWAGDRDDRRSTSGFLYQLGSATVQWKSCKQGSVALSTTEAEFGALTECVKVGMWLRSLLEELGCKQPGSTEIMEDNQGALVWATDGIRNAKHVAIRRNFVREQVRSKAFRIAHCPTARITADILTKPLSRVSFTSHRAQVGVAEVH